MHMQAPDPTLPALRALVFDYDDTLVRTREVRYATLIRTARKHYDLELGTAEIDAAWGTPGEEFMRMLFGSREADLARLWRIYGEECEQDPNEAHGGALDFIATLAPRLPLGILTSSSRRRVLPELAETGIGTEHFVRIQTAEDTPVHKPDPKVFAPWLAWAAEHGAAAEEILYVGDTLNDQRAAVRAGLQFIGMAHTPGDRERFRSEGIPFAESFEALSAMLP